MPRQTAKHKAVDVMVLADVLDQSQRQIAKATGLARSTVQNILNGGCEDWIELRDDKAYKLRAEQERKRLAIAWGEMTRKGA